MNDLTQAHESAAETAARLRAALDGIGLTRLIPLVQLIAHATALESCIAQLRSTIAMDAEFARRASQTGGEE